MESISLFEVLLRTGGGVIAGALMGLEREVQHKSAGMRTMALVGLAAALFTLVGAYPPPPMEGDMLRVIQGIVIGVGFVGGGIIVRPASSEGQVHGLTTAASFWVVAAMGVAAGLGAWPLVLAGLGYGLLFIIGAKVLEKRVLQTKA